jgi:hypothetical protein
MEHLKQAGRTGKALENQELKKTRGGDRVPEDDMEQPLKLKIVGRS